MAKKPPIRVALDLETTGLHAEQDAILEVAAIRFQGATVLDTFETLITPGRPIPYRVQRLTGILPQHVADAPRFEAIAGRLQQFIGDYPLVGHSIPFDVGFLRRRGLVRTNPLIDTFELATVMLPSLPSYNLGQVAEALDIPLMPGRHRAMVDTRLAMDVFLALHQLLEAVDLPLLRDLANLDAPHSWPLLGFFRQELRERMAQDGLRGGPLRGSLGDRFAAQLGMDPRVLSFAIAREDNSMTPVEPSAEPMGAQNQRSEAELLGSPPDFPSILPSHPTTTLTPLEEVQTLVEAKPEQEKQPTPSGYHTAYMAVRQALEQRTPLLMEVTVGANDYTPALLPALEWLADTRDTSPGRLVIACSTAQAARRLVEHVLPRLQASLKTRLPVAYLAEHGGYLCIHRWFGSALRRTSGELSAEQARGLAKLALWAQQTQTGERSELTLLPQEITAWERISSGVEHVPLANGHGETPYSRCLYRRKGYCFVSRAEERVKNASIVVTTHAGLFDDLSDAHSLLSSIDWRLILDAAMLDEESARWNSAELDQTNLVGMLNTIGTELPDGRYQGLLALAAPALRENGPGGLSTTLTVSKSELDSRMLSWFQILRQACTAVDNFFSALYRLMEEFQQQGANNGGRDKEKGDSAGGRSHTGRGMEKMYREKMDALQPLRLTAQIQNIATWKDVERSWQQLAQRLQSVIDVSHEAEKIMLTTHRNRNRLDLGSGEDDSVAWEFAALAERLLEQQRLGQKALTFDSPDENEMVYWLRIPPPPASFVQQTAQQRLAEMTANSMQPPESSPNPPILHAQLVQTAPLLKRLLLSSDACTIFAGVALSVDNSFSFYRGRYGLDAETCPAYSVVTEHHEQTLLYLPNDVPEPNMPQYQRHLDEAIVQLASTLDGQLVVLFTSYAALRSSYAAVKPLLEAQGILVLGHGIDGSPRQLWQMFSDQERVVLLGTGSFWEGVDEITRTPSCIVIARLPMPVLNDPPMAARAEHYSDQLHAVTVPIAALRMRRALNRLAWSGTRRNAVVVFDRRVISKEYGATILHTLPRCSGRQGTHSQMPETILDWLTASGAWE